MSRRSRAAPAPEAPAAIAHAFAGAIEASFELRSRYGFDPPSIERDRAEHRIRYAGPAMAIDAGFYGLVDFQHVGIAVVPERHAEAFSLTDTIAAVDPEHHARAPELPERMTVESLGRWMDHHAAFFHAHADELLWDPSTIFARVRAAAPPGEQCRAFVALCRELWDLEGRHGFEPPRVIHWRHELEVGFRKGPLRLELRLEDHEHAGVAEPLTVPTLTLHDDEAGLALPLALAEERLDPAHHATRPVAPAHAMRLERLRPFLEHTAAFFAAHPELLEDRRGLRELVTARDG